MRSHWLAAVAMLAIACRPTPPAHRGPILLVTIDALRADVVGALGGPPRLTPHLDALAAESALAVRAVAPSSWTVPSMPSLFTGLQPWRHGLWGGQRVVIDPALRTLPEALAERGYHAAAFRSNRWLNRAYGWDQGFDLFRALGGGRRAEAHLAGLGDRPEFVWVHILAPHMPYQRHDEMLDRLAVVPSDLPAKLRPPDLEPYFDPAVPMPPELKARAWALYQSHAAWADDVAGRLFAALKRGGAWERALVVVTADHGEEFEERGQVMHGGNLGRVLVEVPLIVKTPRGFARRLKPPREGPIATVRLFATLVEAAGGEPGAEAAPSLFREAEEPVLSELYMGNGENHFSLVAGDRQLLWAARYAPPDPDYYRARLAGIGATPVPPLTRQPGAIFAALDRAFDAAPPLSGRRQPELELWRWTRDGVERLADDGETRAMARRLRAVWQARNGPERPAGPPRGQAPQLTPEEAARLRALGYVVGGEQ